MKFVIYLGKVYIICRGIFIFSISCLTCKQCAYGMSYSLMQWFQTNKYERQITHVPKYIINLLLSLTLYKICIIYREIKLYWVNTAGKLTLPWEETDFWRGHQMWRGALGASDTSSQGQVGTTSAPWPYPVGSGVKSQNVNCIFLFTIYMWDSQHITGNTLTNTMWPIIRLWALF